MIVALALISIAFGIAVYALVLKLDFLLDPTANVVIILLALSALPLLALTTGQFEEAAWHGAILFSVALTCRYWPPYPVFGTSIALLLYANGLHFIHRSDALALDQTDHVLMWRGAVATLSACLMINAWREGHIH